MDYAHKKTDEMIAKLEREIAREYRKANRGCKKKLEDHLERFATKDATMSAKVKAGEISQKEYDAWRVGQMATGQRYQDLCDTLAKDLTNTDKIARSTIQGHMSEAYALNHNYGLYQVDSQANIAASFSLYDSRTVERLWREKPDLMPKPSLKTGKALNWNNRHIRSAITQGILQGDSIPKIANRMNEVTGAGYRASVRAARTSMTAAQNAGRVDGYKDAEDMGVKMKQMWLATLDERTRASHVEMDGEVVPVGETFSNGCKYPADPECDDPGEVYNCRCTLMAQVEGFEIDPTDLRLRDTSNLNGKSYEEWKESKGIPKQAQADKPFEFTPAQTIKEAEEYASQYVDESRFGALGVSYKGVSLDVANEVNRTVGTFFDSFDVEKLGGITAPAGNTRLGKQIQNATAAYSDVRRSLLLNRNSLKNMKTATDAFAAERNAIKSILEHPELYDMDRASPVLRRVVENSKISGRGTIPQTIEEAINHELGHSFEKAVRRSDSWEQILGNMTRYNQGLSGYACENQNEYIAESFCSYMKGENKCDPTLARLFDSFRRK